MNQTVLPPLRHKPYGGAWSIHDPESVSIIDSIKPTQGDTKEFLHDYSQWFKAGKDLQGIGKFSNVDLESLGKITEELQSIDNQIAKDIEILRRMLEG